MEEQLRRINDKLQLLLRQYRHLQKDHERLQQLVTGYEEKQRSQQEQVEQLSQQVLILRSAAGQLSEADKAAFEKKLTQYIRQIDKCINFLNE